MTGWTSAADRTALIICDMWNVHYCRGATDRVAEMAPRVNETVVKFREHGAMIIHAPSDTMAYYKSYKAHLRAVSAPRLDSLGELPKRLPFEPGSEGTFPIDQSQGGCGCSDKCPYGAPQQKQIDLIEIHDEYEREYISDSVEIIHLLKHAGIAHVYMLGVHTNYCILARPFGIRQLVKQGFDVTLVRDLTDSLYNPAMAPYADHFTGTDLVVKHIEKYWCPAVTSDELIGGVPFRFQEDTRGLSS